MAEKIDFRFLKAEADFLAVLAHYGIEPAGKGVSRKLHCPFHNDKTASCTVNLGRRIFHCFGCGAKGNILDFVRLKENLPEDELRAAGRKLAEICSLPLASPAQDRAKLQKTAAEKGSGSEAMNVPSEGKSPLSEAPGALQEVSTNTPLKPDFIERFEAKLVREHPYFRARGLSPGLVEHFGLGFCPPESKSMMKGRVTIPIFSERGELLAYCGRWVGDVLPEGSGKYLFPAGFYKHLVVYNLNRVLGRKHLVVVEGFFSVFRLHALGVPAVALMGSALSPEHVTLLREAGVRYLTFLLDSDEAGRDAVPGMMARLASEPFRVKFALLPDGTQPDKVPENVLRELLVLKV